MHEHTEGQVTITATEYKKLLAAFSKLSVLEAAGVDDWEGYGEAMASYEVLNAE